MDEISGLVQVEFMKNKSEVPEMIVKGVKKMQSLYKLPVSKDAIFQSDGEAVYKGKKVNEVLTKLNLYQQFSPAYHPERNGTAERTYRTCFNDARAMLMSSPLPATYYPLAIEHAVLIRNLLPRENRKISAYESLTKQDPKNILERLHTFGAKAFVHNQKDDITKMQEKAFEGIYIGYDLRSDSHKVLNVKLIQAKLFVQQKLELRTKLILRRSSWIKDDMTV